jgi:hypothetical protein
MPQPSSRLGPPLALLAVLVAAACSDALPDDDAVAGADAAPPGVASQDASADAADAADAVGPAPCGADAGTPCAVGAACASDDDCEGLCAAAKVCAAPTHDDGKRSPSLGETDVDGGGPTAPACAEAQGCAADGDCATEVCSVLSKTCVVARSCRGGANGNAGLDTCGPGEVGAAGAAHESCCRSLPLPERTDRRLDRYAITSGRLRAFLDALAADNAGVPNVRAFAKAYAAAHPTSQLADVAVGYPGLLEILPERGGTSTPLPMAVHLGAFPLDPINTLDGCYVGQGGYGHATYWQPPSVLKAYGIGAPDAQGNPDGTRSYSREQLDTKPVNCVMPLFLAAFCAWDGGELARTADYREVWGRRPTEVGNATVYIPWSAPLSIGQYNFRNGHGGACNPPWAGCVDPQPYHYAFPLPHVPATDDSPAIAAPGRFSLDVTAITSASGAGWYDVGANLMDSAWLAGPLRSSNTSDVCDVSVSPGPSDTPCTRRGIGGVLRFAGDLPGMALIGYSFEGHARRSEAYLSSLSGDEALISSGDLRPITFQYGKVGGRCARPAQLQ